MSMAINQLPIATARRLPIYHRYLQTLSSMGKERVSSAEVGQALHIDSATVRRDFSHLGELGKKGYGYSVPYLVEVLQSVLMQDELVHVILVGVGNLGTALCKYNFYRSRQMSIVAAFDVDPEKIGHGVDGIPVFPVDQLVEYVHAHRIDVAILAVPAAVAQATVDLVVGSGIRGILNFSPRTLVVPDEVRVRQIDMTTELQTLVYYLRTERGPDTGGAHDGNR
ncbi:MAG: redox-sensing transcriptional repressor Rex [Firmicutes bacterium]|nr:redox-sensing transcriptional repressor Rex [Bacillota bacterium]